MTPIIEWINFNALPKKKKLMIFLPVLCWVLFLLFLSFSGAQARRHQAPVQQNAQVTHHQRRQKLHQAKHHTGLKNYYDRLREKGKIHGVAINNVKHKLLHIMCALVRNDCDYQPGHLTKCTPTVTTWAS